MGAIDVWAQVTTPRMGTSRVFRTPHALDRQGG